LHGVEICSDPAFAPAAHMASARSSHTCSVLPDGRVLVVGGREGDYAVAGAEIFDPVAGSWSAAGNVPMARWGHMATLLSDGSVLIAGGENESGATNVLERFNPIANSFTTLTCTLASPRRLHAAAVLPDGRVLVAGGNDGANDLNTAELIDPFGDAVLYSGDANFNPSSATVSVVVP
jgi:hypothetical protein